MDVRPVRPTDAPLVLSLSVDERAHIIGGSTCPSAKPVVYSVLRAAVPMAGSGRAWLARGTKGVALAEAKPRRYVIGWDLSRLAVRGSHEATLGPLLRAVTAHLQERGVPRLFARCRDEVRDELQRLDFSSLARDLTLIGPNSEPVDEGPIPLEGRYRMRQDDWPLHQLESEVTPPLIRHLEGLTSIDWSRPIRAMSEIVVERNGRVVAWVAWGGTESGMPRLGMLVHPQHADLGSLLLRHAQRRNVSGCRFITHVRDYQTETLRVFREAGFEVVEEATLMVKHAAVEAVRAVKPRTQVAALPSVQGFHLTTNQGVFAPILTGSEAQKEQQL